VRRLPLRPKRAALRASQGFVPGASPKRNQTEPEKGEILLSRFSSHDRKDGKNYEVVNGHKNEGRTLGNLFIPRFASLLAEGIVALIDGSGGLR